MNSTNNKAAKQQKPLQTLRLWTRNRGKHHICDWRHIQDFVSLQVSGSVWHVLKPIQTSSTELQYVMLFSLELWAIKQDLTTQSLQVLFIFQHMQVFLPSQPLRERMGNQSINISKNGNILDMFSHQYTLSMHCM